MSVKTSIVNVVVGRLARFLNVLSELLIEPFNPDIVA